MKCKNSKKSQEIHAQIEELDQLIAQVERESKLEWDRAERIRVSAFVGGKRNDLIYRKYNKHWKSRSKILGDYLIKLTNEREVLLFAAVNCRLDSLKS